MQASIEVSKINDPADLNKYMITQIIRRRFVQEKVRQPYKPMGMSAALFNVSIRSVLGIS